MAGPKPTDGSAGLNGSQLIAEYASRRIGTPEEFAKHELALVLKKPVNGNRALLAPEQTAKAAEALRYGRPLPVVFKSLLALEQLVNDKTGGGGVFQTVGDVVAPVRDVQATFLKDWPADIKLEDLLKVIVEEKNVPNETKAAQIEAFRALVMDYRIGGIALKKIDEYKALVEPETKQEWKMPGSTFKP